MLIFNVSNIVNCDRTMAKLLSGKDAAAEIRNRLQVEVASYGPTFKPGLTILQVCVCFFFI